MKSVPLFDGGEESSGAIIKVAFCSRGRGRGHAIPDLALADELTKINPAIRISRISYGTGAEVLRAQGHQVSDLGLPDENPFLETLIRAARVLGRLKPDVVITHEDFSIAPAARLFGLPVIVLTDYFLPAAHQWMQCLRYADRILFLDEAGHFEAPSFVEGRVAYTAPFVRDLKYTRRDRERLRKMLRVPPDCMLALVLPGSWFTEERAPLFDLVSSAFQDLPYCNKALVWFAAADYPSLSMRASGLPGITVCENSIEVDAWMAASDVAITKGTRKTSLELCSLGVPAITISPELNPIDDWRVRKIPGNLYLTRKMATRASLIEAILRHVPVDGRVAAQYPRIRGDFKHCARLLAEAVEMVRVRETSSAASSQPPGGLSVCLG